MFTLLDRKTAQCYSSVLQYIHDNIVKLDCRTIISDYELALQKAIQKVIPNAKLNGCWFHFCQAVRRNMVVKFKSLPPFLRSNTSASILYHKLLALPLLPAAQIDDIFNNIKADVNKIVDDNGNFKKFLVYFENQWMKKVKNTS